MKLLVYCIFLLPFFVNLADTSLSLYTSNKALRPYNYFTRVHKKYEALNNAKNGLASLSAGLAITGSLVGLTVAGAPLAAVLCAFAGAGALAAALIDVSTGILNSLEEEDTTAKHTKEKLEEMNGRLEVISADLLELKFKFDQMDNIIQAKVDQIINQFAQVLFMKDITIKLDVLMQYMILFIDQPSNDTKTEFIHECNASPPFELIIKMIANLKFLESSPLHQALKVDPLKTEATGKVWKAICTRLMERMIVIQAVYEGAKNTTATPMTEAQLTKKMEQMTDKWIEAEAVLDGTIDHFKSYYWPDTVRSIIQPIVDDPLANITTNLEIAECVKEKLLQINTPDHFFIYVTESYFGGGGYDHSQVIATAKKEINITNVIYRQAIVVYRLTEKQRAFTVEELGAGRTEALRSVLTSDESGKSFKNKLIDNENMVLMAVRDSRRPPAVIDTRTGRNATIFDGNCQSMDHFPPEARSEILAHCVFSLFAYTEPPFI